MNEREFKDRNGDDGCLDKNLAGQKKCLTGPKSKI